MQKITGRVMDPARCYGACAVGEATVETLAGGPPLPWVLRGCTPIDISCLCPNRKRQASDQVEIQFSMAWNSFMNLRSI